jgi:Co/Zn/Cd efflux system component
MEECMDIIITDMIMDTIIIMVMTIIITKHQVILCMVHSFSKEYTINLTPPSIQIFNNLGMFLHVLADTLGSVGVIISSLLIQYFGWTWADPICSLFIAGMITASSWPLLKETGEVLLLRAPRAFDLVLPSALHEVRSSQLFSKNKPRYLMFFLEGQLKNVEGVYSYSDARVWEISHGKYAGSIRIQIAPGSPEFEVQKRVQHHFYQVGLGMMVIQIDRKEVMQYEEGQGYPPQYPGHQTDPYGRHTPPVLHHQTPYFEHSHDHSGHDGHSHEGHSHHH